MNPIPAQGASQSTAPCRGQPTRDPDFFRFARKADKTRPSALDGARGKDALLLNENCAGLNAVLFVGPDSRSNVIHRVDGLVALTQLGTESLQTPRRREGDSNFRFLDLG